MHHVSSFLSIQADPVDQPAATDPVERRTWCALRVRIAGRVVTRIWDRTLDDERSLLYVPAFPIAEWLVNNWWALLNEPCRTERVAKASSVGTQFCWIKRHCLRSAEAGMLLPALYLYNAGRGIRAEWQADQPGELPNMPGEFIDSGCALLPQEAVEDALAGFVNDTLDRVRTLNDQRVEELATNWQAIRQCGIEEARFCTAAGRLGLDPYDPSQVNDDLAAFIEHSLGDPDLPVARDLTEVAEAGRIAEQWSWIQDARRRLNLGPGTSRVPFRDNPADDTAAKRGYRLAQELRIAAGIGQESPIHSLEKLVERVAEIVVQMEPQNHVPGQGIRSVVGWSNPKTAVVAGPCPARKDNARFQLARAVHHLLFSCQKGERLVTDAYTWDQQASRAFAAELLAPQKALEKRTAGWADRCRVQELADEFKVSTVVIEKQLENAGIELVEE
ncbi:MAG: hypothetical protein AMXMBFR83_15720 [Phycisphaerae bacterium]